MSNLRYLYETMNQFLEVLQKHLSHFLIGLIFFEPFSPLPKKIVEDAHLVRF